MIYIIKTVCDFSARTKLVWNSPLLPNSVEYWENRKRVKTRPNFLGFFSTEEHTHTHTPLSSYRLRAPDSLAECCVCTCMWLSVVFAGESPESACERRWLCIHPLMMIGCWAEREREIFNPPTQPQKWYCVCVCVCIYTSERWDEAALPSCLPSCVWQRTAPLPSLICFVVFSPPEETQ